MQIQEKKGEERDQWEWEKTESKRFLLMPWVPVMGSLENENVEERGSVCYLVLFWLVVCL